MRNAIGLGFLGAALLLAGCAHHKPAAQPAPPVSPAPETSKAVAKPVIKPDLQVTGQIAMVNAQAHFVVINFPPGPVPQPGQHLNVYRNGQKVGEVAVTGPQREYDTVADIVTGDIQVHDEARAE